MPVNVSLGEGSFENFTVYVEGVWEVVPKVGEYITLDRRDGNLAHWAVEAVRYIVDRGDALARVEVLVSETGRVRGGATRRR